MSYPLASRKVETLWCCHQSQLCGYAKGLNIQLKWQAGFRAAWGCPDRRFFQPSSLGHPVPFMPRSATGGTRVVRWGTWAPLPLGTGCSVPPPLWVPSCPFSFPDFKCRLLCLVVSKQGLSSTVCCPDTNKCF